jgi:two-component system NtrC family sensor kinase
MKIGRIFPDLLRPLSEGVSLEDGLGRAIRRITRLTGARGGLLIFRPARREPLVVKTSSRLPAVWREWLAALAGGQTARRPTKPRARVLRVPLGMPAHPVGELILVADARRRGALQLPTGFPRELGAALVLLDESRRRADELSALLATSRLITARLDLVSVLDRISKAVTTLTGATGCGIGLLTPDGAALVHAAAHGFKSDEWRALRLPVGEGIIGRCADTRAPILVDDVRVDPRSARRDVDEREGIRSMLCVPMLVGGSLLGVIAAFSTRAAAFAPQHQRVLEAFAEQAGIAIHNASLHAELEARVKERTRQLDEEKRFMEVVLETLPLGVFVLDDSLGVLRANPAGTDVLRDGAASRQPFRSLFPPDKTEAIEIFLRDVRRDAAVRTMEEEMAIAGGTRTLRLTAAALAASHLVVLVEDVTRAKRMEQQMLLAERLTTAGRLAAGVAHELNNPLATIAGCAEALAERARSAKLDDVEELADLKTYLATIEEEAYRCKEITGTLLQFVREPGSRREPTDVNALVARSVELLAHQSRFAESLIVTELDPSLPEVTVNEGQLRQVILGLGANALESMDGSGRLTVRTRLVGEEAVIEIVDEGPGIAPEVLPRIFDPFFTTKPPGQGTGLGLAIAQGIIADHAGRIEVESKPGAGATFRVVVPA